MQEGLEQLIDRNLTLIGIEDVISDAERGLNMNLKSIDEEDGGDYIAIFEHPSHRKRVTAFLEVFKTADEAAEDNLPPEAAYGNRTPEHNGPRATIKDRESAPDIHNYIFTVKHIERTDILKTYPEPM